MDVFLCACACLHVYPYEQIAIVTKIFIQTIVFHKGSKDLIITPLDLGT
uniref:Uncharacterized protein n=1 Tax=Rhizophora mucronata TaxID=61149 RepID=A0A2P2P3T5_RHIMU